MYLEGSKSKDVIFNDLGVVEANKTSQIKPTLNSSMKVKSKSGRTQDEIDDLNEKWNDLTDKIRKKFFNLTGEYIECDIRDNFPSYNKILSRAPRIDKQINASRMFTSEVGEVEVLDLLNNFQNITKLERFHKLWIKVCFDHSYELEIRNSVQIRKISLKPLDKDGYPVIADEMGRTGVKFEDSLTPFVVRCLEILDRQIKDPLLDEDVCKTATRPELKQMRAKVANTAGYGSLPLMCGIAVTVAVMAAAFFYTES